MSSWAGVAIVAGAPCLICTDYPEHAMARVRLQGRAVLCGPHLDALRRDPRVLAPPAEEA